MQKSLALPLNSWMGSKGQGSVYRKLISLAGSQGIIFLQCMMYFVAWHCSPSVCSMCIHLGSEPFKTFHRYIFNWEGDLFCRWFTTVLEDSLTILIVKIYFLCDSSLQAIVIN